MKRQIHVGLALLASISLSTAVAQSTPSERKSCRTYSYYVKEISQTVTLCKPESADPAKVRFLLCPGKTCQAEKPTCTSTRKTPPGASPYAIACENCGGISVTGTNIATKGQENLCQFPDKSWALSIDTLL